MVLSDAQRSVYVRDFGDLRRVCNSYLSVRFSETANMKFSVHIIIINGNSLRSAIATGN